MEIIKNLKDMDDIEKAGLDNERESIEIFSQKTGVSIRRAIDIYWSLNPINLEKLAEELNKKWITK